MDTFTDEDLALAAANRRKRMGADVQNAGPTVAERKAADKQHPQTLEGRSIFQWQAYAHELEEALKQAKQLAWSQARIASHAFAAGYNEAHGDDTPIVHP